MPDFIGSQQFVAVVGSIPGSKRFLRELSREELDGTAMLQLGSKAVDADLECTRDYDGIADWRNKLTAYLALVGTVQTVQHYGESVTNVLIMDVQPGPHREVVTAIGGVNSYRHWGTTHWRVRKI